MCKHIYIYLYTLTYQSTTQMGGTGQQGSDKMQYVLAAKLTDFTKGVSSIAFGPSHLVVFVCTCVFGSVWGEGSVGRLVRV